MKIDAAGIGLCAAASLVFYWVTIQPLLHRQSLAGEQRRELATRQNKLTEIRAARAQVQDRLTKTQEVLAAGAVRLEPAAHVNKRVAKLTQFFSECALDVDDVQTGRIYNGLQYDLVPITILGRGPFRQCAEFFHGLRSAFPDMSMARIELSRATGQTGEQTIFQFGLLWYAAPGRESVAQDAPGASPTLVSGK